MKARLAVALLLAGLVGCLTLPKQYDFSPTLPVVADFETAWSRVINIFAELGLPIATIEKVSGLVATDWIATTDVVFRGWFDCGKSDTHVAGPLEFKLTVVVKDRSVMVTAAGSQEWRDALAGGTTVVRCEPTGGAGEWFAREIDGR